MSGMDFPSQAETAEVDALLAGVGLRHGKRRLRGKRGEAGVDVGPGPAEGAAAGDGARAGGGVELVEVEAWREMGWLMHGFSTRRGGRTTAYRPGEPGELNLGETAADSAENVAANRAALVGAVAGEECGARLMPLRQIHSSVVHRVAGAGDEGLRGDGLMSDAPGVLLAIQTADCIPVLVVDRRTRAVAGFHAGWRGTVKRIVENGVGRMRLEFGSRPEDLSAAIGPGIGACCYAVGEEVRGEFESQFAYAPELFSEVYDSDPVKEKYPLLFMTARAPGHSNIGPSLHLNLPEANRRQLLDAGVRAEAIHMVGGCTSCDTERFYSYRAERGFCGRMMSVIGIRG
jgi:YfiH family protein